MSIFLATCLLALGFVQLASVYFKLRGMCLVGPLDYPGMLLGVSLITLGAWFVIDQPWWLLLIYVVPALIVAYLLSLLAGVIVNITWNPTRRLFNPQGDDGWTVEQVQIPVTLTHVFQSAKDTQQALQNMPATFLKPKPAQAENSPAEGAAVLVICGAGDTRSSFKWRLFRELLDQGIAVLTIDPPGHGDFMQVPMTVANARAAGKAAMAWLCGQQRINRVGVCGISFGGCQAAALAAEDPNIQAVAMISTPIHLNLLTRRTYIIEALSLFIWPRNLGLLREGSLWTLWKEWRSLKGAQYGQSLYEMIDAFDVQAAIHEIGDRPKLIVHGSRDFAIPVHNARQLYELCAPQRELLLIRQATHLSPVLYAKEMQQLAAWFAKWLNYNRLDAQQAVQP